jgi:hypothetical protein
MVTLIAVLTVGITSISWAIVRCMGALVTQRLTQEALRECPPAQRAGVLRAAAELAGKVSADRAPSKSITLSFGGRRRDG